MAVGYFSLTSWRSKTAVVEETRCSVISVEDIWLPNRSWDSSCVCRHNSSTYKTLLQRLLHICLQNVNRKGTSFSYLTPTENKTSHQVLWEREGEIPCRGRRLAASYHKHYLFLVTVPITFSGMAQRFKGPALVVAATSAAEAEELPFPYLGSSKIKLPPSGSTGSLCFLLQLSRYRTFCILEGNDQRRWSCFCLEVHWNLDVQANLKTDYRVSQGKFFSLGFPLPTASFHTAKCEGERCSSVQE